MNGLLKDVPHEHHFRLQGGGEIRNMRELARAMKRMPDGIFFFHANEHKNDFSSWIQDCILDKKLADQVRSCKSRKECQAAITKRMQELSIMYEQISKGAVGEASIFDIIDQIGKERQKGPSSPQDANSAATFNRAVQDDLTLLSQGISEESFLKAYFDGNFISNVEDRKGLAEILNNLESQEIKDTEEGLKLWADQHSQHKFEMQSKKNRWKSNFVDLPIFNHDLNEISRETALPFFPDDEQGSHTLTAAHFSTLIQELKERVESKNIHGARHLFQFIKSEFEKARLEKNEKQEVFSQLKGLFDDIKGIQP
ncbi:MAG: hypothetical protein V1743_00070 [Nanoarchaeota archaeon]